MKAESASSSFSFKLIERFAVKGLGLVVNIILARLLLPSDYGLLALVNIFVNLAQTFVQTGMGTALVQNQTTREEDYSTVFLLSFGTAIVMMLLICIAAPFIAAFYETDALVLPLRVMSLSLLFAALNSILTAKLQRNMQFKSIMKCNLFAAVVSGLSGIIAASCGLGIWALVIHHFSHVLAVSLSMSFMARWRPHLTFSLQRAKVFFGYGWKLLLSGLICSLYYDIRGLIIGYRYSTEDLAFYTKAQQYPDLFTKTISESVKSVSISLMSRAQDSKERIAQLLRKSISLSMFLTAPILLGLAAVAKTLIPLLLTDKWSECIPYLCIFCFGNLPSPFLTPNLSLLMATGDSTRFMHTEFIRRIVMIATLFITVFVFDSVMAIAIGYALGNWLDAFIVVAATRRTSGVGFIAQILHTWKALLSAIIMFIIVWPMNDWLSAFPVVAQLGVQIISGIAIYALLSFLLHDETFFTSLERGKHLLLRKKRST